jgi:nitrate/TMAO reductase-like tetraheme cytochrome c subunit
MTKINARRKTIRYPAEFDEEFKRKVKERDNYTCAMCHKRMEKLDIHHIDYTKHTVPSNCISLCRGCHSYLHMREWTYKNHMKEYFRGLIAALEFVAA